jgi:hypothetical protein
MKVRHVSHLPTLFVWDEFSEHAPLFRELYQQVPDAFEPPHPGVLAQVNPQQGSIAVGISQSVVSVSMGNMRAWLSPDPKVPNEPPDEAVSISQSGDMVGVSMGDMGIWFGTNISKIFNGSPDEDL